MSPVNLRDQCAAFALVLTISLCPATQAQESGSDVAALPQVNVVGLKSPLEFPYLRAYEAARSVIAASDGLTDLVFKLHDKSTEATNKLRLTLEYGDKIVDIPLDANNVFILTPDAQAAAQSATLVVNRGRQSVSIQVDIRPNVKSDRVSLADIERLIQAGRAARASLLPWYARLVTPTINSVRVCSSRIPAVFAVRDAAGIESPLQTKPASDINGRPAACVDFAGGHDGGSASSQLVAPEGSTFDYMGSLF